MSTFNRGTVSPHIEFREVGRVVVDAQLAQNSGREGARFFEEGTGRRGTNRGAFAQGFTGSRVSRGDLQERPTLTYDVIQAGQAARRVEIGASSPAPSWNKEPEVLDQMFFGASGDQGDPFPPQFMPRAGANRQTITPLGGLNYGERRGNVYNYKIGDNPRRRNEADVSDR